MISISQPQEDPEQVNALMFPKPLFSEMCLNLLIVAHGKERELPYPLALLLPMSGQRQMNSGSPVQRSIRVEEK